MTSASYSIGCSHKRRACFARTTVIELRIQCMHNSESEESDPGAAYDVYAEDSNGYWEPYEPAYATESSRTEERTMIWLPVDGSSEWITSTVSIGPESLARDDYDSRESLNRMDGGGTNDDDDSNGDGGPRGGW